MRRFIFLLMLFCFTSCGVVKNQNNSTYVKDKYEQLNILYEHYPKLWEYYHEGVMDILWIKKVVKEDGTIEYKEGHRLKRKYITDYSEKMSLLKTNFPEIYNLFTLGKVNVDEMYQYVGTDGEVRVNISYHRL